MTMKQKNEIAMQKGFPELYERMKNLSNAVWEKDAVVAIDSLETLTETNAIVVELKDGSIYRLNSAYHPEHEAEVWSEAQTGLDVANLFIFGLGNGVFAKELIRKKGSDTKVVIYEPSIQVFRYAMEKFDLQFCFQTKGVRLIVENVNEDLFSGVMEEMITFENFEDYSFIFCPQLQNIFPESRKKFLELYASKGIGWMKTYQNIERYTLWISPFNQMHNLRFLENSTIVPYLGEVMPKDIPVILIGAGPSLKKEVETLKKVRDKAFLFAADSALSYLIRQGILPDAFVSTESGKAMTFFEDEKVMEIPAFVKVDSRAKLLIEHKAPKIFGHDTGFPQKVYEKYGIPQSKYRYGSNGMTALFSICDEMGVKNIIFVGQDMCFGTEKQSHVGGRDEGFEANDRFLRENNQGEIVQSRADWVGLIDWYENGIIESDFSHVINTSVTGAKIRGTEYMTLEDAICQYGKEHEDFADILSRAKHTFDGMTPLDMTKLYKDCQKELEQIKKIVERNPKDDKRKEFMLYQILKKYEVANVKENLAESQREGLEIIETRLSKWLGKEGKC